MILESIAVQREVPSLKVEWTKSHPERRKTDRQEWTFQDGGIYLADAVAARHWYKLDQVMSGQPYLRELTYGHRSAQLLAGVLKHERFEIPRGRRPRPRI
jgi:hypothetical protein